MPSTPEETIPAAAPRFTQAGGPPPRRLGPPEDEWDGRPGGNDSAMRINNARFGMLMFLAAEGMLFSGFIGAFMVFRFGNPAWPPPMQPRLPVEVTGINTVFLLASGYTIIRAYLAMVQGAPKKLRAHLLATAILGIIFLSVQGYEWTRLIGFGLTLTSGIYGSTFYTLIGFHALHVLGAVVWLIIVYVKTSHVAFRPKRRLGIELCGMYWCFVVAVWPILFGLVYL